MLPRRTSRGNRRTRIAGLLPLLLAVSCAPPLHAQQPSAGAAAFNGTWETRVGTIRNGGAEASGEFKIWALDDRRLQLEFVGLYAFKTDLGPTAHSGQATGVAVVDGGKAVFRSEVEGECGFVLVLRLRGDEMVVRQSGYTCFGHNVIAEGTYRRLDASRPTFEISGPPQKRSWGRADTPE